jgi:serine/threonine-protein kinase
VEEAVGYALDALDGLAQAHSLEIIHRDLKPANLFLAVQASGTSIVKIVDFGISKSIASRRSGKTGVITADHSTVGSPTYMAPEQIKSPKDVGAQSDIWSLGVVLYELLSGAPPFSGDSVGEIFAAVLENKAPPLSRVVPTVPEGVSRAVARCMARNRSERYANVLELAVDLAPFGPPDAAAKVTRIEQTLRAMKARAESKDAPRASARGTPEPEDVTAEITASGSHDIRIEAPEPGPPSAPSSRKLLGGKVSGGFSSDTPRGGMRSLATLPSIRRVEGRRRVLAIAGGAATLMAIGMVAFLRSSASSSALAVQAVDSRSGVPSGVPSAMTLPPTQASHTEAAGAALSPAQPVATTISVDQLPSVKSKQQAVATPLRKGAAPSPPAKRHLSVLDSPD